MIYSLIISLAYAIVSTGVCACITPRAHHWWCLVCLITGTHKDKDQHIREFIDADIIREELESMGTREEE